MGREYLSVLSNMGLYQLAVWGLSIRFVRYGDYSLHMGREYLSVLSNMGLINWAIGFVI